MSNVSLYYTNDFHSHVPEALKLLYTLLDRKSNSIVVDTGDFSGGHPFFSAFSGIPERRLIELLYDLVAPGNHGFQDLLVLHKNQFPVVNANIFIDGELLFKPFHILERGGYTFGFTGIISSDAFYAIEAKDRSALTIKDPNVVLETLITWLRAQVDIVVVLSHSGFKYDQSIAETFSHIDIILSGHCHSDQSQIFVNKTLVTKAPELGRGIGELILSSDGVQKNTYYTLDELKPTSLSAELDFLAIYLNQYQQVYNNSLFTIPFEFVSKYKDRRSLVQYFVEIICSDINADWCIINYHCLRGLFPAGKVTKEIIYKCIPFETTLVTFKVDKQNFIDFVSALPSSISDYLCMSKKNPLPSDEIYIVTTNYLTENYFSHLKLSNHSHLFYLSDFVIHHFKEISNCNDFDWH